MLFAIALCVSLSADYHLRTGHYLPISHQQAPPRSAPARSAPAPPPPPQEVPPIEPQIPSREHRPNSTELVHRLQSKGCTVYAAKTVEFSKTHSEKKTVRFGERLLEATTCE